MLTTYEFQLFVLRKARIVRGRDTNRIFSDCSAKMASDNLKIFVGNIVTGDLKDDQLVNRKALVVKEE